MGSRRLGRAIAVSITVALVVAVAPAAWADTGPGPATGNWTKTIGPSGTYGYASWDATNAVGPQEFITLRAYGSGLGSGNCVTTWFDWGLTPITHYDARAVRDCSGSTAWDAYEGYADTFSPINGMQKLAVCHGANNTLGSCSEHPQRTSNISGVNPSLSTGNFTTR